MLATVRIHASLIGCITHILVIESCTRGKHHVSPYRGQRSRYSLCVCVCVVRVCVCVCVREREREPGTGKSRLPIILILLTGIITEQLKWRLKQDHWFVLMTMSSLQTTALARVILLRVEEKALSLWMLMAIRYVSFFLMLGKFDICEQP